MDSLFTFFEIVLIRNEIGLKSFQEIADILEKPLNDVKEIAVGMALKEGIVTYQSVLDKKKKETKKVTSAVKERHSESVKKQKGPQYETKPFDPTKLVAVKVDDKTIIFIKPGEDATAARMACLERLKKFKQDAYKPIPVGRKKNTSKGGYFEALKNKRGLIKS